MTRASPPTCTSSLGALISISNEALLSPFADALADALPFAAGGGGTTAEGATVVGAAEGGAIGAAGSVVAGVRPRLGVRSTSNGGASIFSGGVGFSGGTGLSSTSTGRDTPVLVSVIPLAEDPVRARGAPRTGAASYPPSEYAFVFVHRSHQSPTVSYQSFE